MKTFEEYLQEQAVEDSPETMGGGSDGHQEGCERWIENLDASEVMEYAQSYGKEMFFAGFDSAKNKAVQLFTEHVSKLK